MENKLNIPKKPDQVNPAQDTADEPLVLDWQQKRALEYLVYGGNDSASQLMTGEGWFFLGSAAVILSPVQLGPMLKSNLIQMDGHRYVITDEGRKLVPREDKP